MCELNLSVSETIIVRMGLRALMDGDIKPTDKMIAEEVDRKIRMTHEGEKIRMMVFENEGTNLKR